MCETTLLNRIVAKVDAAGGDISNVISNNDDLEYTLRQLILKSVRHECLFDNGLIGRARMRNWATHDQENCFSETVDYFVKSTFETFECAMKHVRKAYEEGKDGSEALVDLYALVLGLEYTLGRRAGLIPSVEEAADI